MLREDIKQENCQRYKFPHGAIYIGPSDETVSAGFMEIAPDRSTNKLTYPLPEHIKQIEGNCEIEMFDDQNRVTIKRLSPGEVFMVPVGILHVHRNRGRETSINYWEYQGNADSLIQQIRADGILDEAYTQTLPKNPGSLTVTITPQDCQGYKFPTGTIYIGKSDKNQSFGFIQLHPGQSLDKQSWPVDGKLKQVTGSSQLELYQPSNEIKIIKLGTDEETTIPANQFHIHSNPNTQTSLTYWQFDGDVTSITTQIRAQGIKI